MSAPGRRTRAGLPRAGERDGATSTATPEVPADAEPVAGVAAHADASDPAELSGAASAAGDSLTVAAWTAVSRLTGLARFAVVGAVLGPTYIGNTYQFTNSLPNLVYYGFLAGSMFSSLLVPALVRHIDADNRRAAESVAGGFLGVTLLAMAAVTPVAIIFGPLALRIATLGGPQAAGAAEAHVGRLLITMVIPQMLLYGVIGTATAVMNARRRFALAAGAPTVENLGTIAVLLVTAALYGTGGSISSLPTGELLLLGLGSTGAVALHATTQWWGARRAGVVLLPRPGWRDSEVRAVVRRALPALAQAGLSALQLLALLIVANRLPGGIVAFQIAWTFTNGANMLATAPVALSLLPRLARMHLDGNAMAFRDTFVRGLALAFFVAIPAAVGTLVLTVPLATAISFGRMASSAGVTMVAAALGPLSAAVVGQTAFMITTDAFYARKDTRSPVRSMMLQTALCLSLVSLSPLVHGPTMLSVLGLAVSGSAVVAACHVTSRMWRTLGSRGTQRLAPSMARFVAGAVIMAGPAWLTATAVSDWLGRPFGQRVGIVAAALVGVVVFVAVQALWRTPEVGWLAGGLNQMRGKARRTLASRTAVSASLWDRRNGQHRADHHAGAAFDTKEGYMTPDDTIWGPNGHAGRPPWDRREDQGRQLARLTARQLRRAPGVPASRARFLAAHAVWILAVTIVAVGTAGVMVLSQTPLYTSQATVAVEPPAVAAGSGTPVNMATEEDIVTSGAVLETASRQLNVPVDALASGLSVHVPGTTTLLQITYSDSIPRIAQQRAQAIAQAYVSYRSAQPAAANRKSPATSAPVSVTPSAVLVTPASLPGSPTGPNYLIDIGAALIVGLALAIGTAAFRDYLDDRLRGPLDLEAQAAAPVLALIPAFRPGLHDRGGRLPVVANPDSVVAEAYRGLRTRVVQAATSRNAKTVLVTCPGWEDKSTVAANLAAALAQSGRDVVLICADLRWGRAHELFGQANGDGLRGLLEGQTSLEVALQDTEVPGLWLLPPGVTPADPAALLERPAWPSALGEIRMRADAVVIEAPPILTGPDAHPLADLTEMMLIVTDARGTTRAQLRTAMREVEPVRGKLAGCILDNVGRRRRLRPHRTQPVAGGRDAADGRRVATSAAPTTRPVSTAPDTAD